MPRLYLGVDAGGTQTRAVLATPTAEVAGVGCASGANVWSSGTPGSKSITSAVREALGRIDPTSVAGSVIAIAGGGLSSAQVAKEIDEGWQSLDLRGSPAIVPDVLAAYAAGTTEPRGLVVAAGTGAIAALVSQGAVESRAGGHGWLVGDEGSAVWLGRKGTQAALQALDGRGQGTLLATAVPDALDVEAASSESIAWQIVQATYDQPPARIGELAPVVIDASARGDRVAQDLVEAAADHLAATGAAAMGVEHPAVVVLAGSLLTRAVPLNRLVRTKLAERWPAALFVEARSGEAGAVALAIARDGCEPVTDAGLAELRNAGAG